MKQVGPVAPKNPEEKLKGFYILLDTVIEGAERKNEKPSEEIYLDCGRLESSAKIIGGIEDDEILHLLKTTSGFRKLVKKIGISVTDTTEEQIGFALHNYGKIHRYEGGTILEMTCPCDGGEYLLDLGEQVWSDEDDVVGKIVFSFHKPGAMAKASVKLYVDEAFEVPEVMVDPPVNTASLPYQQMIARSLVQMGNNARLKDVITRAKRGEDVTIAYIGGSITEGAGAKPVHSACYARRSFDKFKARWGVQEKEHLHFIKAGLGGTSSELGMIRYEHDVLADGKRQPDLVVIEFAVNDEGDETKGVCYESLVCKCLMAENKPAVILLFSVFANDYNLQERLAPIGRHYELPMISVKDAVVPQFALTAHEGRVVTKRQFFYDLFHPTNIGHEIMADCLMKLWEKVDASEMDEELPLKETACIGNAFQQVKRLERKMQREGIMIQPGGFDQIDTALQYAPMDDHPYGTPQFPCNWMHTASSGEESFKLTITSRSLLLVYMDSGSSDVGKVVIYVDGNYRKTVDPKEIGWLHVNAILLYSEEEMATHKVEIRMAEGDEDKCFTILGFGYTENE